MDKYVIGITISHQADVDALAKEIEDAIAALKIIPNGLYNMIAAYLQKLPWKSAVYG